MVTRRQAMDPAGEEGEEDNSSSSLSDEDTEDAKRRVPRSRRLCVTVRVFGAAAAITTCLGSIMWVVHTSMGQRRPVDTPSTARGNLRPPAPRKEEQSVITAVDSKARVPQPSTFSMDRTRTFNGSRLDLEDMLSKEPFSPPDEGESCERWAVLMASSSSGPTKAVSELADMRDWCIVVVGDKNGPAEYDVPGVTYLSPTDQEALPYRISSLLPWNHLSRKSVGYMYAIHHGAKVIYDVDDNNTLTHPMDEIPHSDTPFTTASTPTFAGASASAIAHNPYPCFGGPANSRPRGFPLDATDHAACNNAVGSEAEAVGWEGRPRPFGVVQSLANHNPDVDALYRLSFLPGGRGSPFSFGASPAGEEFTATDGEHLGCPLTIAPKAAFTPYNAQATLHFLPAFWGLLLPTTVHERVSDIWRSYFTQTLLHATGAVIAIAPPWVNQEESSHDYLADFHEELALYENSGALLAFLAAHRRRQHAADDAIWGTTSATRLPQRVEDLAVAMYEHGVLGEEDVALTQAWLEDMMSTGYVFDLPNMTIHGDMHKTTPAKQPTGSEGDGGKVFSHGDYEKPSTDDSDGEPAPLTVGGVTAEATPVAERPPVVRSPEDGQAPLNASQAEEVVPDAPTTAAATVVDPAVEVSVDEPLTSAQPRLPPVIPLPPPPSPFTKQEEAPTVEERMREAEECQRMRKSLKIIVNQSWGRASESSQQRWKLLRCDEVVRVGAGLRPREGQQAAEPLEQHGQDLAGIAEPPVVMEGVAVGGDSNQPQEKAQQPEEAIVVPPLENETAGKPQVLLLIAVVSIRPERRAAIRNSWLAWGDDRMVLRFFTEAPDEDQPAGKASARALAEESTAYGDVVVLDIDRGMNFALKLISAMRYSSERYRFDFFLRLDDDYFVCLRRLLEELESLKNALAKASTTSIMIKNGQIIPPPPRMLYAGKRHCERDSTRIDEAYMLLSAALVERVLSTSQLQCGSHGGISAGWWFTPGHNVNPSGDVQWVDDTRLDHFGKLWKLPAEGGASPPERAAVCGTYMGVHHAYPEQMAQLWAEASAQPGVGTASGVTVFRYLDDGQCPHSAQGVTPVSFNQNHAQPCESFHNSREIHCGAQGCGAPS